MVKRDANIVITMQAWSTDEGLMHLWLRTWATSQISITPDRCEVRTGCKVMVRNRIDGMTMIRASVAIVRISMTVVRISMTIIRVSIAIVRGSLEAGCTSMAIV